MMNAFISATPLRLTTTIYNSTTKGDVNRRDGRRLDENNKRNNYSMGPIRRSKLMMQSNEQQQHSVTTSRKKRLGVLVSGGGRSVENLCERIVDGRLSNCEVVTVIVSKSKAGAIEKVTKYDIPYEIIRRKDYDDSDDFSEQINTKLNEYKVDYIIMAGWMHFYKIPSQYNNKVINIHPSLIPSFCGKGFYGMHVHEAVISFGVKISGCTVHLADNEYDHGPIILQKTVHVLDTDSAQDVANKVFEQEKEALPQAIQLLVDDRIQVSNKGIVKII